jgi:hypothetical protein
MWARILVVVFAACYASGLTRSSLLSADVALEYVETLEKRQLLGGLFAGRNGIDRENSKALFGQRLPASTRSSSTGSSAGVARPSGVSQDVQRWDHRAKTHSFQIVLAGALDLKPDATSVTPDVDVYDVDLFFTSTSTIKTLHLLNKTVICYFSAGTYEPGRPDSFLFRSSDMGSRLLEWPKEKWLRTGSMAVRRILADRIQLAAKKGCDAIDADNIGDSEFTGRPVCFTNVRCRWIRDPSWRRDRPYKARFDQHGDVSGVNGIEIWAG